MKTNNKAQEAPERLFLKAACKFFKCKPEDIQLNVIYNGSEAAVTYQEQYYRITTREAIRDYIKYQLGDKDMVHHVNLRIWIAITKNTISIKRLLPTLVSRLYGID